MQQHGYRERFSQSSVMINLNGLLKEGALYLAREYIPLRLLVCFGFSEAVAICSARGIGL